MRGSTKTGADWAFSFDSLSPGTYQLIGSSQDKFLRKYRCPTPAPMDIEAGKTAEVVVNMQEGIPLRGKLVRADGQPVANGYISARIKSDRWANGSARTESDGSWEMYLPREGEYDVQYSVPGAGQSPAARTIKIDRGKAIEPMTITVE